MFELSDVYVRLIDSSTISSIDSSQIWVYVRFELYTLICMSGSGWIVYIPVSIVFRETRNLPLTHIVHKL